MGFQRHIRDSIFDAPLSLTLTTSLRKGHRVMCVNAAFEKLTGYELHEVVGRKLSLLHRPDDKGRAMTRLRADLAECHAVARLVRNVTRGGDEFLNLVLIRPFQVGNPDALQLGAQFRWTVVEDLDPDKLDFDPAGGIRHIDRGYLPLCAATELRMRLTLFNSYFRVIRAYLSGR